jgi:hypothetical protein
MELLAVRGDWGRRGRERGDRSGIDSSTHGELECWEVEDSARARRCLRTGNERLLECWPLRLWRELLGLPAVGLPAWRGSRALLLVVLAPGARLWSPELGLRG